MNEVVEVRKIKIGEGSPKICVPIVGVNQKEVLEEAKVINTKKSDLVEWRIDYYEDVDKFNKVKETLLELRRILSNKPILITFRSANEGGQLEISKEDYYMLIKSILNTQIADLVDVELFMGEDVVKELVQIAHNNNVKVVMSSHDFDKTPPKEEIINRLRKMQDLNADLPKIAVMPKNSSDVLSLLCATEEMRTKYANRPIITMSMAGIGTISRISGEIFGSSITFASLKKASAPGQIQVDKLNNILKLLHDCK
ncbi:MAG: type I 3-dehydroquinate dehydratase [Clostridiaceae bacterium]|nr:type I 3-dehydroquinate dehydratase [Clostridiaceae bacterium]